MASALLEQIGGLVEDRRAFLDFGRAPHRPGACRGGERLVEVGGAGERQIGDAAAGDGIDHAVRVAALAAAPIAVDEELKVCVIGHGREIGPPSAHANPS